MYVHYRTSVLVCQHVTENLMLTFAVNQRLSATIGNAEERMIMCTSRWYGLRYRSTDASR